MPIIPATSIEIKDDGVIEGYVGSVDFVGAGVSVVVTGDVAAVTIPGGGGGGGSATRILLNIPFPAKREQQINVIDAAVTATDKINAWLSGLSPEVIGSGDAVDMYNIQPIAKAGSFDLVLSFLTPFAGSLSVDYSVFA